MSKTYPDSYHWRTRIKHSHNWVKSRTTDIVAWKIFLWFFSGISIAAIGLALVAKNITERGQPQDGSVISASK